MFNTEYLRFDFIAFLIIFPINFFLFIVSFLYKLPSKIVPVISFWFSIFLFYLTLYIWLKFDTLICGFQFIYNKHLIWPLYINFIIGIDGLSLCLILLVTYITPLMFLLCFNLDGYYNMTSISLILLEIFVLLIFLTLDLLIFYISFEGILIPMYLLTIGWGYKPINIKSTYYFFLYGTTLSFLMLFIIIVVYCEVGSTCYLNLLDYNFSTQKQFFFWICFFLVFAAKIPIIPFHIWLPEAHAEAPTVGSVALASIFLKVGGYGFIRYSLIIFLNISYYFLPLVFSLCLLSILFTSLVALRQLDIKKIIAYSSVAHMNIAVLGLFSFNIYGIQGGIFLMLSHSFTTFALFLLVGILYNRYNIKSIMYCGGLVQILPTFSFFFLIFLLANTGLPGTGNFIGEFLSLLGFFFKNKFFCIIVIFFSVVTMSYSMWLFNRICLGCIRLNFICTKNIDVDFLEFLILSTLLVSLIFIGLYPNIILNTTFLSSVNILYYI